MEVNMNVNGNKKEGFPAKTANIFGLFPVEKPEAKSIMKAVNANAMRSINRKIILDHIRRNPISRAELAELTGLTRASVTQIIDGLMEDGFVEETDVVGRNRLGRRNTQLALRADARYFFGVNLSRLHCDVGMMDLSGNVCCRERLEIVGREPEEVLCSIAETILGQREKFGLDENRIGGIGVCAPGPLDIKKGVILNPPNFDAWHGVAVGPELSRLSGIPVMTENVSNAHALDEKFFGVARDARNFVLLRVDEGVGSGTVINNRLFHGTRGFAAEYGHVSVDMNGPLCSCGNRGCLEKYISIPAILRNTPYHSWREAAGDEAIIGRMAEYLAFAIINIFNSLDVEKVILAGELAEDSGKLIEEVNRRVANRIIFPLDAAPVAAGGITHPVRQAAMPALYNLFDARKAEI